MTKKTLCMIPGPVEFEDRVLASFAHEGISHVDSQVLETFGSCLEKLRKVRSHRNLYISISHSIALTVLSDIPYYII